MIHIHQYPVCEYDETRDAIIRAEDFLEKCLPEKCVITFFRKELENFVEEHHLPAIGYLHSEVLDIPIYKYETGEDQLCITMPFSTAPGAAGTIEELHAMGCNQFVICGGAGCLQKNMTVGNLILPTSAVRDEGTSYHYLPPAREVVCDEQTIEKVRKELDRMNVPYVTGKTWTTDAFYRETLDMVKHRKEEGCITVEMETAAFFAVAKYYQLQLAQILYAGDDVSGEKWDKRAWNQQKNVRANLIELAIKIIQKL